MTTWSTMKEDMMQENYDETSYFKHCSPLYQTRIRHLRKMQKRRGNMEAVEIVPYKWCYNEQGITTLFYRNTETGSLGFDIIRESKNSEGKKEHNHMQRIDDTNDWIAEYPLII